MKALDESEGYQQTLTLALTLALSQRERE